MTKTTTMQLMTAWLKVGHMTTSVTCASNSFVTVYNRGTRCCTYRHVHGPSTMHTPDGASMSHFSDSYRHMLRFVRTDGMARDTRHPPLHKDAPLRAQLSTSSSRTMPASPSHFRSACISRNVEEIELTMRGTGPCLSF